MPLVIAGHGGGCCGIRHIHSFGNYMGGMSREDFILKALDSIVKAKLPDNQSNIVFMPGCSCLSCVRARETRDPVRYKKRQEEWITAVECVLAGDQYKTWKKPLERCGFKEVFSFKNSNSRNMCHVFYGVTNPVVIGKEDKRVESAPSDTEIAV